MFYSKVDQFSVKHCLCPHFHSTFHPSSPVPTHTPLTTIVCCLAFWFLVLRFQKRVSWDNGAWKSWAFTILTSDPWRRHLFWSGVLAKKAMWTIQKCTTYILICSCGHGFPGGCDDDLWERDTAGEILILHYSHEIHIPVWEIDNQQIKINI